MKKLHIVIYSLLLILPVSTLAQETTASKDRVVVTVNGVPISEKEVAHFIAKQGKNISTDDALRELINVELFSQTAKNENIMQDESLNLEIKRVTSALIASTYLQNHLRQLEISEDDIKARYKTEYIDGNESTEYNANHILVKTEAEAQDVISQLDKGAEFTELAKTLSIGPSGKKGGALGWFGPSDMVAPFAEATTQLSAGKYSSKPVRTEFGFHVILLNEIRKTEPPELESVRQKLTTAIAADSIKDKLKTLHDDATIKFIKE